MNICTTRCFRFLFAAVAIVALVAGDAAKCLAADLPRESPESQGVSAAGIREFVEAADQSLDSLHSFMLVRHGKVVAEGWWAPYQAEMPHALYSLSKSFAATAVGLAIAEGKLRLDDEVLKFFPDDAPAEPSTNLKAMRVSDLLRMNTGHQVQPPRNADEVWTKVFLAQPVPFKPGTHFLYNTSATYMLSAIVQKATGEKLVDYLQPRLFQPLGIAHPSWESSPQGINTGGYGLSVGTEDIAKFGQLYLQEGKWEGKQVLPAAWVNEATARQTSNGSNPQSDWDQGYGYQFWRCRHGAYRGDGAFGQFCIVLPEQDAVIAITSGVRNMQAVLDVVWDKLLPAFKGASLPPDDTAVKQLKGSLSRLAVRMPESVGTGAAVAGQRYTFAANEQQLEAITLESGGAGEAVTLVMRAKGKEQRIVCGRGSWTKGKVTWNAPEERLAAACGAWTADDTFTAKICFCETPFVSTWRLKFSGDALQFRSEANVGFGSTREVELVGQQAAAPATANPPATPGGRGGGRRAGAAPPIQAKAEELAIIRAKTLLIETLVKELKEKRAAAELVTDVEVFAHAGKMLLAYPDMFGNQAAIEHALTTLEQGIERGLQLLLANDPQWNQGKRQIHAYVSEIDGAVLPYGVTLPENYDPTKPTRLYVWLHGRQNTMTETEFIYSFLNRKGAGNPPVADQGQIQLDCFGRINGAGWHWAGERDVFESIEAVKKRFAIDDKRIMLRGFSQGGEGAWHLSLHHPDRFAAAEIGAGTVSRTAEQRPDLTPYQLATLRIWENISEWALNIHNLPLAGHDGEHDVGQLESSLRARRQLEKEGFPSVGEPDFLRSQGVRGLWMQSLETGHGTSPLVRQRLDAFLKEHGDRGQSSPDHIRFLTYTTRYNRCYWVSLEGLGKHYERAEVNARRTDGGSAFEIETKNLNRLTLRETEKAKRITIDGQTLRVSGGEEITLSREGASWKVITAGAESGLHKRHALQGPIDDAFLDPFLLVRPTGKPWNESVHQQALRTMARFERLWGRFFRGHPFVKDDKDVTEADFAKYHVVLFGDPGSNSWMAKIAGQLPVEWSKTSVKLGGRTFSANECYPAMIYPNPLQPTKYVVLNTGLTIDDRGYNGDYGTPLWGDYAIVKVKPGEAVPEMVTAGLFNEQWQLAD